MSAKHRDYYETLGVKPAASAEEIRSAYRRLVRELHPDINKAPDAAARFNEVQQAYDILSDPEKRRAYDRFGAGGQTNPFAGGMGGGPGRKGTYSWTNVGARGGTESGFGGGGVEGGDFDAASIFEEIFGRGARGAAGVGGGDPFGGHARARSRPTRGKDITQDHSIDFMLAVRGGIQTLRIRRGGVTQTMEVTIPMGVAEGAKLRMRGAGSPSSSGGPPGDLILVIRIEPHPWFRREGRDILLDLPLSITEATLGATAAVPTLSGRAEVTVPPGTTSGQRLRLRGQGVRTDDEVTGDLYVCVRIVPPHVGELGPEDRAALEALARRLPSPRTGPPWSV